MRSSERAGGFFSPIDGERQSIQKMVGEAARELGVLVIAFYPLELRTWRGSAKLTLTWVSLGLALLIAGMVVERRRTR